MNTLNQPLKKTQHVGNVFKDPNVPNMEDNTFCIVSSKQINPQLEITYIGVKKQLHPELGG